jgi:hypothetical protein
MDRMMDPFDTAPFEFTADLWRWKPDGSWVFLSLPADVSEEIRQQPRPPRPGFGSIRVRVTIGGSTWKTSIFPDSTSGCYVLPVKRAVRTAEGVDVGDAVDVRLELLE